MQEEFDVAGRFADAQNVRSIDRSTKRGDWVDLFCRNIKHFGHFVDDNTHFDALGSDHNNAGFLGLRYRRHTEFQAQINNGNDFASQVDHAPDKGRRARHWGDAHHANDLLHLQDLNTVFFVLEKKCQKFSTYLLLLLHVTRTMTHIIAPPCLLVAWPSLVSLTPPSLALYPYE